METVRVLCISTATKPYPELQSDLLNILNISVDFNARNEVTGILYYGYGYFIHYLEGPTTIIKSLVHERILKDSRHQTCEILLYESFHIQLFKQWSMKYAPVNEKMKAFFRHYHQSQFNPYLLSSQTIPLFISMLEK